MNKTIKGVSRDLYCQALQHTTPDFPSEVPARRAAGMKTKRPNELRKIEIIRDYTKYAAGSVLVKWGNTWVLCTASVEDAKIFRKVRAR